MDLFENRVPQLQMVVHHISHQNCYFMGIPHFHTRPWYISCYKLAVDLGSNLPWSLCRSLHPTLKNRYLLAYWSLEHTKVYYMKWGFMVLIAIIAGKQIIKYYNLKTYTITYIIYYQYYILYIKFLFYTLY